MASIGLQNSLRVVRAAVPGLYLDGGTLGEILLPGRYAPKGAAAGTQLDVFIYRDSEDRLVATTEKPLATVGQFAFLKVVSSNRQMGAFLDWGLSKDLLLPIREQARPVTVGERVVAAVFLDEHTGRIVASTRLNRHLGTTAPDYAKGDAVSLIIADKTPLGFKAIVANAHWGLLYASELSTALRIGEGHTGYVRAVRPDGKIDLGLDPAGYKRVAPLTDLIVAELEARGGRIELDDQSTPDAIRDTFQTSKKAFKQATGALYRARRIRFTEPGIELVKSAL